MNKNRLFSEDLDQIIPFTEKKPVMEWLAEQMPGGFFVYRANDETELLYVNQAACDIFGCKDVEEFREHTGNSFQGMVHSEDYDAIQESIDEQIADTANSSNMDYVVYRIIRRDGDIRWVDDYGHFASLPGYGDVYYVFIGDITEKRLAEEEREKSLALSRDLEKAEQANEAKIAFLSNMSHEIRTPITAILGMNEMIQREADNSVILEYSENIRKAGESLLGIISDILDFSKIETGRMDLECEEYSVGSMAEDLYNLIWIRAEAKGLDLNINIDPGLPRIMIGDEIRVKQIISNLLTNAVKYTETGSVTFDMHMQERFDDRVKIAVSVSDTGIGIRNEDMKRLFEPFDRLDLKKTRGIQGSGLGLSITRQMLSIMGCDLNVESEYGKGSRFYFSLIQQVADDQPVGEVDLAGKASENFRSRQIAPFTAPAMKILVVDDTPMNLQVVVGLLKRTRMHIDVAESGEECIKKIGEEHFDMVFLDYRMPGLNGIETLHEIRRLYPDKFRETPVIALTASAVSGDKEKMINAGFTDYLAKPINIEEMEHMLIKFLPEDSVIITSDEVFMAASAEEEEFSRFPSALSAHPEINPEKGIEYCGDVDDYIFALVAYESSVDKKVALIEENLSEKDFEAYTLNVHSLKSTSAIIGAMALFEKARALELAGKKRDYEIMKRDTPFLLKKYRELRDIIREIEKKVL